MKYTPKEAINFTKMSVALLVAWPPPMNTSKTKLLLLDVYFCISILNILSTLAVLVNGMYVYRKNLEIIIHSTCTAAAISHVVVKMLACRAQRTNLQSIVAEMEDVVKNALPYEKEIIDKYMDKCALPHLCVTIGFYLASIGFILGPVFLPQPLPTFVVYPFNTDTHPIYDIVYLQQVFTGLQASAAAAIDCQAALFLWFAGARFEMLRIELVNIADEFDLRQCIVKHQHIVRYAENVVKGVRFTILSTVAVAAILMIFSGMLYLFTDSAMTKVQSVFLDFISIIQLFVTSYPAENLLEMSSAIGIAAYDSNWINNSGKMWKSLWILIQRSQKSVTVSVGGFLPYLSLNYYMSFLSSSFSYFTTMRAVV